MKKLFSIALFLIVFGLCDTPLQAIEVEYHLYRGWNLIAVPCSTDIETLDELFPFLVSTFIFDPAIQTYDLPSSVPAANNAFWAFSPIDTYITIECECVDVRFDICDPLRPVVLNGDTISDDRIIRNEDGCVTIINLNGMSLTDTNCIDGIELYDSTLAVLSLFANNLADIDLSPLASCTNLKLLYLDDNTIFNIDLTPLATCVNLERLELEFNALLGIDLAPLTSCINLEALQFDFNFLEYIDLTPLESCINLETLHLDFNFLTTIDLTPLWDLDSLDDIMLRYNNLDSASCTHICDFIEAHPDCYLWSDCSCP